MARSLSGLNSHQREAVQWSDSPLLVVAGAGSGKTRVLTHKIAYLIEECGVRPWEVLAMTFSNKAAREMSDRVRVLLPSYDQPHWIGTFHSICLRILKEFHLEAALSPQFTIYDETDQLSVIKRIQKDLSIDPKQLSPKAVRYYISSAKNETTDIVPWLKKEFHLSETALKVVAAYERTLAQNQALDFGDLLTRTVSLLRNNPTVAQKVSRRWHRILIDEYQDTNEIQKQLVLLIAQKDGIVCAVGDEDQSIYGWRGARIENMLDFTTDFTNAKIIKLEQNYRSTRSILSAANEVIANNVGRRAKNLWTENGEGELGSFYLAENDHEEAEYVIDEVEKAVRGGNLKRKDTAVFYRTHVQSRVIEDECRRRNIPYRIFGGVRFYDRAEIKDTLAFLKLALNPSDDVSFERIINTPSKGIGKKSLDSLRNLAQEKGMSMLEAIPALSGRNKAEKALRDFYRWFSAFQEKAPELLPAEATEKVLDESGYWDALEREDTVEASARLENLEELLRSMNEYSESSDERLPQYMDRISLITDMDRFNENDDSLALMTVHNSKGLEFDSVYVVGMEEGIFPHQRSIEENDDNDVEEERRLCYVAMTRARKNLCLTAAQRRRLYRNTQFNPVSRFVAEIPKKFIREIGAALDQHLRYDVESEPDFGYQSWPSHRKKSGIRSRTTAKYDEYHQPSYDDDVPAFHVWGNAARKAAAQKSGPYAPGAKVLHPDFGLGTIKQAEGAPDNLKLTIQFRQGGTKKILLNYCTLELVEK